MELLAMKPKLYLETTIPSCLTSRPSRDLIVAANQLITRQWWEERRPHFEVCVSQFVIDEVASGDPAVAAECLKVIKGLPVLATTAEAVDLARKILQLGLIPQRAIDYARHIALAATHQVDFLMTWNCSHIASPFAGRRIKRLCEESGFECPVICTPHELLGECASKDPILEEVRRLKDEHTAKYGFDVKKMFAAIKKQEQKSGRKIVSPPTKRRLSA
jgi:hypothetical protein